MMRVAGSLLERFASSERRWRLAGRILRAAAPVIPSTPRPAKPVFILGSPRSGTTLLFDALNQSPELKSLAREGHLLWEMFHELRDPHAASHEVGPDDVSARERKVLYWAINRVAGDRRYLDKTPRNSLRVEYLHALFADAWFVHLVRDGRAAISSLITAWQTRGRRFAVQGAPQRVDIAGYDGSEWRFLVPPGWERYSSGRSLAEVCAYQWVASNAAILDAKAAIATQQWITVKYEDLVAAPPSQIAGLLDRLGISETAAAVEWACELDSHVTTTAVTLPRRDKWREEHAEAIAELSPAIRDMMTRLGYRLDQPAYSDR